jgi:hypothetical protein
MKEKRLTPKQTAGIAALLRSDTLAEAARKAGVSEWSMSHWCSLPHFQLALGCVLAYLLTQEQESLRVKHTQAMRQLVEMGENLNAQPAPNG